MTKSKLVKCRWGASLVVCGVLAIASPAAAVTVMPADVLPDAKSYEYIGLNFAENIATSTAVGTLDYSGQPGCGGLCTATTALGSDPSVTLTNNEVVYDNTAGGSVSATLGYFVDYVNTPGTYSVDLHATDSISATDGASASTYLQFGKANDSSSLYFNNFATLDLQEADCVNTCYSLPIYEPHPGPFVTDHTIQIVANTLYYVQIGTEISPGPSGVQDSVSIDPTFTAPGGSFRFSPGIFNPATAVPEPAAWTMMIAGLGAVGATIRRRRQTGAHAGLQG